jgi:hypothetical protein
MDSSTLTLHRELLRLVKGAATVYAKWLAEQEALLIVESLKERKKDLSQEPVDK